MKFIIEHLEHEMYEWCLIEYEHISKIVGKKNLLFTKVPKKDAPKLKKYGEVLTESVLDLKLKNACLLDPKATQTLKPSDSFEYFIFGGILGDYPEQGRTEKYLTSKLKNVKTRNLGTKQMSTDTAVLVTKTILDGTSFEKIPFIDEPEIALKKGRVAESILLPYRYVAEKGKPVLNKKLLNYLKKKQDL